MLRIKRIMEPKVRSLPKRIMKSKGKDLTGKALEQAKYLRESERKFQLSLHSDVKIMVPLSYAELNTLKRFEGKSNIEAIKLLIQMYEWEISMGETNQ